MWPTPEQIASMKREVAPHVESVLGSPKDPEPILGVPDINAPTERLQHMVDADLGGSSHPVSEPPSAESKSAATQALGTPTSKSAATPKLSAKGRRHVAPLLASLPGAAVSKDDANKSGPGIGDWAEKNTGSSGFGESIGSVAGSAVGSLLGPVGAQVGGFVGSKIGAGAEALTKQGAPAGPGATIESGHVDTSQPGPIQRAFTAAAQSEGQSLQMLAQKGLTSKPAASGRGKVF